MHVHCEGTGAVTIVLIAGFGGDESSWGAIAPTLSASARLCTYSRFGTGTSDPPPHPQTFTSESQDLHSLLTTIGEPGPYVVVGHSFGGAQAVAFAASYPGDVSGVVLIDASPSNWNTAICAVPDDGTEAARGFVDTCTAISSPAGNPEQLDGPAAFAEVSAITSLGAVPMTVITATLRNFPGLNSAELARLTQVWNTGQQQWAALSPASSVVTVDDTGHDIQLEQPQIVIDEITRLLP
jgi:pimeloyl-ACP methyl ester carboxylesterase